MALTLDILGTAMLGGAPYWGYPGPTGSYYTRQRWFEPMWVYVIASGKEPQPVKIGISRDIDTRIHSLEAGNPFGLRLLHSAQVHCGTAMVVESRLHSYFSEQALGREWFNVAADDVAPILAHHAERATVAARRWQRELLTADHRAQKELARLERRQQEAMAVLEAERRERMRVLRAERVLEMAARRSEERAVASGLRLRDARPRIPPGVEGPRGNSPRARLQRYLLARGLTQ